MLTPAVKHFAFLRKDNESLTYIPGQFISLHFEHEGKILRRSYSIATQAPSLIGPETEIEFAISYIPGGPASELLMHLEVGETLQFSGPYGRLILRDEPVRRLFLMATGTGVTPYRAMLPALSRQLAEDPALEVYLCLGVQYRQDQLYTDEFLAFAAQHPRFHFTLCLSREASDQLLAHEYAGYVQHTFSQYTLQPETDIVYLCGNPHMIDDAFAFLKEQGFTPTQVRREKYV